MFSIRTFIRGWQRALFGAAALAGAGVGALGPVGAARAQCETWLPGAFINQPQGINGVVLASFTWTPANGPEMLVVGGNFSQAGGAACSNIAAWDGASWRPLGSGVNGTVNALWVYNGELIAGGSFNQAGGAPASCIARFNFATQTWQPLGGGLTQSPFFLRCGALAEYQGDLIAGGKFTLAGGVAVSNIARWNGTTWSAMLGPGSGVSSPNPLEDEVRALRVHNDVLYIGGWFSTAGGSPASNIASFDPFGFAALGLGCNSHVNTFHSWNGELVVGGAFSQAGGISATHVARWTGTFWNSFPVGLGGSAVNSFQPFNGQLVAGGDFFQGVLGWNGTSWVTLNGGISGGTGAVHSLFFFKGQLTAGGNFTAAGPAGSTPATNIAQYSGSAWSAMDVGAPQVYAITTMGSRLVLGGAYTHSTTSGTVANNIVTWNGATLAPLLTGLNSTVSALKSYSVAGPLGGARLLAGGAFTTAGGVTANRVALWSESNFTPSNWSAMGNGFNDAVLALERHNNITYAGGLFTSSGATPVLRIAQWTGSAWAALGAGMNGPVYALKSYNGQLYAGGAFTTAGGITTGGLARWNTATNSWSNVGGNFLGTVYALEVHDGELVIGGDYPGLSGSPDIARYNGATYSTLGTGGTNSLVRAIASVGGSVYIAGGFTQAGGIAAQHVARWNAVDGWSDASGGTLEAVFALGGYHGEVNAGIGIAFNDGEDSEAADAPNPSNGWARYTTGAPWIATHPFMAAAECHQDVTATVGVAPGYTVSYQWHKDNVALANGPTGSGSTIAGATSATLTVGNVSAADQGAYHCVVSNTCGSEPSIAANLAIVTCCPADITDDGLVDVNDLLMVINTWGACVNPGNCPADIAPIALGGNGAVNVDDLLAVINGWGACP